MADEEKKPAKLSSHIHIKVNGQDGSETFFRIRRSMRVKVLMDMYCESRSLDPNVCVFLLDGKPLREDHTPLQVEMEDGDEIDAMFHQDGGAAT